MKTECTSRRHDAGMTLVEVLLVVFIMGLIAGVAVMTLPSRDTPQEKALQTVRTAIEDVRDRAVLTGEVLGLRLGPGGFELVSWTGEEWLPTRVQPVMRLPQAVRISFAPLEGKRGLEKDRPMALVFNPLGVNEPIRLEISMGPETDLLEITPEGEVVDAGNLE